MKKISSQELKKIANKFYFDIDHHFLDILSKDFDKFLINLEKLNDINVDNIEPTDYCVDTSFNELRKDIVESCDSDKIIANAKNKLGRYVVVK